ncbi:MAG TPA: FoF1 ATP synthase subunit gamma [Candidatus Saccharimonadales bacterium]|nr:FoF1 ATP synthase subunit gamma [Candidatus Saccharimonadales bacterium]
MSQLIQIKQRIQAIASIKKITQTMRLISMSTHSKLKKQSDALQRFRNEVKPLLCTLTTKNLSFKSQSEPKYNHLYVIFAAEKGLCGTFNSAMFAYFNLHLTPEALHNSHVICVGKKAIEYAQQRNIQPIAKFDKILPNALEKKAQDLYEEIVKIHENYESVICLSSHPKTFFVQEAETTTIIPIKQEPCDLIKTIDLNDYEWLQDQESVIKSLFQIVLKTNILLILTNSMLSEQSARFLSMDSATRSAEDLLKSMKLSFNKLRQAKITRELIELISGF